MKNLSCIRMTLVFLITIPSLAAAQRTSTVDLNWHSEEQRVDLDLYIKNPKGEICNYANRTSDWGATHIYDDLGTPYSDSHETFTVDLDAMDCYSSGNYEFHIHHYGGPSITSTFSTSGGQSWDFTTSQGDDIYAVRYQADQSCCSDEFTIEQIPCLMRRKGWPVAATLMDYWFIGTGENYSITLAELIKMEPKLSKAVEDIKSSAQKNKAIPSESIKYLVTTLKETPNSTGGMVIPDGGSFNHIENELSLAGDRWHDLKYEQKHMNWIKEKSVNAGMTDSSEYRAAFEKAVIRLVTKGKVQINNNIAQIFIDGIGVYFRDSYDFIDKDPEDSQDLGCWSMTSPYLSWTSYLLKDPLCVTNSTFREYNVSRNKPQHYGDFRIFTSPKEFILPTSQRFEYKINKK